MLMQQKKEESKQVEVADEILPWRDPNADDTCFQGGKLLAQAGVVTTKQMLQRPQTQ